MSSGEVDTSSIVSEILKSGKQLFVPRIDKTTAGKMDFVRVYNAEDLSSSPAGLWGIKEPSPEYSGHPRANALDEGLDMILMPGVAFDRSMSRLGHGKGYYDRYISKYVATGRSRPSLVALSLQEQMVEGNPVPVDDTDWKVDAIVLPDEVLEGTSS
ncbi:hypothetical protein AAF712_003626 [Marasmius tenuissimus]|uniref:5-formyltetrahydrofolate cyclo-ligase n=1 Tax=Marasmius tenuissimus TaxID=585030 RepID=A0ABR3A7C3_9AGAR